MQGQPCSVQPPLGSSRSRGSLLGAGTTAPPSPAHSAPSAVTEVQQHTLTRKPPREYMPCSVAHARHCRCIGILSVVHINTHTHTHMHSQTHTHTHTHTHNTHITHTHTHTHTLTNTHTQNTHNAHVRTPVHYRSTDMLPPPTSTPPHPPTSLLPHTSTPLTTHIRPIQHTQTQTTHKTHTHTHTNTHTHT